MNAPYRAHLLFALLLIPMVGSERFGASAGEDPGSPAGFILQSAGLKQGLCLVLGESDGRLTAALAQASRLYVQSCTWDNRSVTAARETLVAAGVAGRAACAWSEAEHLPYADNLINLVACTAWGNKPATLEEVLRVLAPGGTALLGNEANAGALSGLEEKLKQAGVKEVKRLERKGWLRFVKPIDPGFDTWTHHMGGADLSYVNDDKAAGPWEELRWIGDPKFGALNSSYWGRVTAGGRLYYLENRAAAGGLQLYLVGRDAYNGFELWRVESGAIGKKVWTSTDATLACDERQVYLVEDKVLVARDGLTGKRVQEFAPGFVPGMVTSTGPVLLACDLGVSPRVATRAVALDKGTGKVLWSRASKAHPAVADGLAFVLGATELEAVEAATGVSRWKVGITGAAGDPALFCKAGVVYVTYKAPWKPIGLLAVYDASSGAPLWRQELPGGAYGMLPCRDGLWLLTHGPGTVDQVSAVVLDPRTGKKMREIQTKGQVLGKCYPAKGSADFLLYSNSWYLDRKSGTAISPSPQTVRSPCALGQCPANGLTYFLPHHCTCGVILHGLLAMAKPGSRNWLPQPNGSTPLYASGAAPAGLAETADEWPMYRKDPLRGNSTSAKLPATLNALWSEKLGSSRLTQAVCAYGLVCVAEPQTHRVLARDAATGKERWSFVADGRVETAPTLHKGLCLFGTGAGSVYALDAKTGREVWRLRAAPAEKYIAEEGQFASAWPIIGGVMPLEGEVYFTCGRASTSDGGLWLFAVEAASGKIRWRTRGGSGGDMFLTDGKMLCLIKAPFRIKDGGPQSGWTLPKGMLSTTSYGAVALADFFSCMEPALTFQRHVELTDGRIRGESLAFNANLSVAGWRYKHGGGGGASCSPGPDPSQEWRKKSGQSFIYADGSSKWRVDDIKQQILALVLAGENAYAAGVPVSRNPKEKPELWVLSGSDGKTQQVLPLEETPVCDGLSAAGNRLYLATEGGRLICFGK